LYVAEAIISYWRESEKRHGEVVGQPPVDLLRQFDSADRYHHIVESFEAEHRPDSLFHSPMVLFDNAGSWQSIVAYLSSSA
jgi:hypothetical protein